MNRIEVRLKKGLLDSRGQGLVKDIHDLGIKGVRDVSVADVYWLDADLSAEQLHKIGSCLLADPVVQEYFAGDGASASQPGRYTLEVAYNAGVVDPVEQSGLKAIKDLDLNVRAVKTAKKYVIAGRVSEKDLDLICGRLLVNPIIQHAVVGEQFTFPRNPEYHFKLERVDIASNPGILKDRFGFTDDEAEVVVD